MHNVRWIYSRALTLKTAFHVLALFGAMLLAYELRRGVPLEWWLTDTDAAHVVRWSVIYALIGGGVEVFFQTERAAWRYVSAREVLALTRNVVVTSALFVLYLFTVDRGAALPRSVPVIAALLSLLFLVGVRLTWRVRHNRELFSSLVPSWLQSETGTSMLVVGAMENVDSQLRSLLADVNSPYRAVGIVTPRPEEVGLRVHGVPVVGVLGEWDIHDGLTEISRGKTGAVLFLLDPAVTSGLGVEQIGELRKAGHVLLRPQSLAELEAGRSGVDVLEEIPLEEFLPRKPISLDPGPLRALVRGKRVLVTGAGGSIGSEICRQLVSLGCERLIMLDHSEFLLFEIDRELGRTRPTSSRATVIANVRDRQRISELMKAERPELVFHAAALKHVELVERNPEEGVLTNVQGTWNVMKAAIDSGAEQFILISTDKAVAPSNVMGATKRVAETLLELVGRSDTRLSAVRFGNVLGSAGSVVPIFRDQIARGGPVTVTHPDVNRFFMTIPEAVQLVLHSTGISAAGSEMRPRKFLLEMGDAVKIVDLARQMIELSGKRPDVDIAIVFSGLKPGEKLAEILFDDREAVSSCVDGIMEVSAQSDAPAPAERLFEDLVGSALKGEGETVRRRLESLVEGIRNR